MNISDLNTHNFPTTPEIDKNLVTLCNRLNAFSGFIKAQFPDDAADGGFFTDGEFKVTSGLRDTAKQAELIKQGLSRATKSNHLIGAAADIYDPNGTLDEWCEKHVAVIGNIGFWMEHKSYTPGWAHFQIFAPRSGNRFFIP